MIQKPICFSFSIDGSGQAKLLPIVFVSERNPSFGNDAPRNREANGAATELILLKLKMSVLIHASWFAWAAFVGNAQFSVHSNALHAKARGAAQRQDGRR
jgi:hypothetical protein